MRAGSVKFEGRPRLALLEEDRLLLGETPTLLDLLATGKTLRDERLAEARLSDVVVDAPIRPPVLFCCGQNYSDHLAEQATQRRSEPEFFVKAGQTIAEPTSPFKLDKHVTSKLDYETELAVVIGRRVRNASVDEALDSIFGYVVVNDLSARDQQVKGQGRMALGPGKNFDGATRMGSWVVTADDVPDPQNLEISTTVNGELRQSNTTGAMIYGCAEIISAFSRSITLLPGTVVATGTPGGTALGCDRALGGQGLTPEGCVSARYLEGGDTVVSDIERVGSLTFDVVEEPSDH